MGILAAFFIALLVAFLFAPYKKSESVVPLVILFFILFFTGIASQYWIVPFGPILYGVSWVPMLLIVVIFAMLFSADPPRKRTISTGEESPAVIAIGVFIWILLLIVAFAALAGLYISTNK